MPGGILLFCTLGLYHITQKKWSLPVQGSPTSCALGRGRLLFNWEICTQASNHIGTSPNPVRQVDEGTLQFVGFFLTEAGRIPVLVYPIELVI